MEDGFISLTSVNIHQIAMHIMSDIHILWNKLVYLIY